jgi:hypothetical protein
VQSVLGIFVNQTATLDEHFLRALASRAHRLGYTVALIRPADVRLRPQTTMRATIHALRWNEARQSWEAAEVALPHVVYNRCFYEEQRVRRLPATRALRLLLHRSRAHLLQRNVPGKWRIYRLLSTLPAFRPWRDLLPQTVRVRNVAQILRILRRKRQLIVKPTGGSHGRSVILLRATANGDVKVRGRDRANRPLHLNFPSGLRSGAAIRHWLREHVDGQPHLLQQALELTARNDAERADAVPFDIRTFVSRIPHSKNRWRLIGSGVRSGEAGGLTSNLHGGGDARAVHPFLQKQFGTDQTTRILKQLETVSLVVARAVGSRYRPLIELGLDFGIDRTGRIWLLEVNGKPGRELFLRLQRRDLYEQTVQNVLDHIPTSKRRFRPF